MRTLVISISFLFATMGTVTDAQQGSTAVTNGSTTSSETILSGRVVRVLDGDTIVVLDDNEEKTIRFHGIDAPEKDQDFSQRAKETLSDLVFKKQVTAKILERDSYNRYVCKVYVDDVYVNLTMVERGLAWHYAYYAKDDKDLEAAQKMAASAELGIWSKPSPVPPWEFRKAKRQ